MSSSSSLPLPEAVVKNRFLGFMIWQSITSTFIFILFKTITTLYSQSSFLFSLLAFLIFEISQLLFSVFLSIPSSPKSYSPVSAFHLSFAFLRFLFVSGDSFSSVDFRHRFNLSLRLFLFLVAASLSGFLSLLCLCGSRNYGFISGFGFGLFYAGYYIYKQRWILEFPIIQRPLFYSFKMSLPLAVKQALKLSSVAYLFLAVLLVFLPNQLKSYVTMGEFVSEQIILSSGSFAVFLCWELSHHLHQVLHTKRFVFAPPIGSAAAETNPSEPLLAALEESTPCSLPQYLAYLDLCMVCENNVDTWRRAAFFEETGETYKRVIAVCLRPLEHLTCTLAEGFESHSVDNAYQQSNQLQPQTDSQLDSKCYELLNNFQQCAWCARTVAFLTARSHTEDRFGVAQLSGSNAAVVSTLLSCLLAVEAFMGKKTNLQASHQLMGPVGIKWATLNTGRRDIAVVKKRSGPTYSKAYAIADVLRTSIYYIVSAFHDEMLTSDKAGLLEKDWLISSKPLLGTRELLLQKLRLFLDFRAS
ncbi:uncharacterized protein LOC8267541 [Ricinus communis]|uniref:Nucleoporin protein Ndc1-Nup n=1 Tax=Ricinus communis TaxID=3988 RepID=B9SQ62_RICCO|nr:uncharacterized protein LOC8267541 [Ricinus communis]EEF34261.1 conserved hypothetical protein [Ricinus communis]|eukprot:XP_002528131.1 uncharacterized protein LOC8267541 [Ricinus communis]